MGKVLDFKYGGFDFSELESLYRERLELEDAGKIRYVLNELRFAQVLKAYRGIRKFILDNNPRAEVFVAAGALTKTRMDIIIVTNEISVFDIPAFQSLLQDADNFEVYPRTDDKLGASVAFTNVALVHEV